MIDSGEIHLADVDEEGRRRVLVISNDRFHRVSSRARVAPEILGEPDEAPFPWRVQVDDAVYAVHLMRSLAADPLLDRLDRAPAAAMTEVRRAILNIT